MKLLTIGIPTYNRAAHLKKCLDSIFIQAQEYTSLIEILISNNSSTDETAEVINEYINSRVNVRVVTHDSNIGMDGNFISIMKNSNSQFIWQISDDEILMMDGLAKVITILLENKDIGVLYVNNIWLEEPESILKENYKHDSKYIEYLDRHSYFEKVNYWVTFLSAHIINTKQLDAINLNEFKGTSLSLLSWTIRLPLMSKKNIVLETPILACRIGGQGGYGFIEVFGINFNKILKTISKEFNYHELIDTINLAMFKNYYPNYIIGMNSLKFNRLFNYKEEKWRVKLLKLHFRNLHFYLLIFPGFFLGTSFYKAWLNFILIFYKKTQD